MRRRAPCTYTCTVFGVGSLSNAPIVREPVCLDVRSVRVYVQYLVFGMGNLSGVPNVRGCVDVEVHTVLVLVQCSAWTA